MVISDFAIKRPIITIVVMLTLVIFGTFALFTLKTDEFPDVAPPFVTVAIPDSGGSPETVENEVLDPVEEQIRSISGVKQVQGKAYDGYALFIIEFEYGKNLAEATQVFAICNRVGDWLTGNLLGPIVINLENCHARQIVLTEKKWSTRQPLFKLVTEQPKLRKSA